jgi:hypothetical protein
MKVVTKLFPYLLAISLIGVIGLFIARPALHGGLFQTDDDVQVTRIMAMHEEIKNGQFPVRYLDSFGNGGGYFLFNFYSPLVYYLGASLVMLGFSYLQSVKLVFLIFITLGILGMILLLKSKTSWMATFAGVILFLLTPYLFHDLFHRGALPESAAFLLSPYVFWAFIKLKTEINYWYFLAAVSSFALVVLTHILTGAMVGACLVTFLIISRPNKKTLLINLLAIFMGLTLAGFYFFPAVLESKLIRYDQTEYMQHGYLSQFVEIPQQLGLGEAVANKQSFLGFGLTVILALIIYLLLIKKSKALKNKELFQLITFVSLTGLFLMMSYSSFIWAHISWLRYLQFPYRILTILIVLLCLGFGLVFDQFKLVRSKIILVITCLILPTIFYFPYYSPLSYQYIPEYQVEGRCRTTAWEDEHFPKTVADCMPRGFNPPMVESLNENLKIENIEVSQHGRKITFTTNGEAGVVKIAKYYFPGWQAFLGQDQVLDIIPTEKYGLISFELPVNTHGQQVSVTLGSTMIREVSNWLTIITSFILLGVLLISLPRPIRLPKLKL